VNPREPPANDRLDSWKEIAAYLKRDVTTARRWEKREGLPVHRHPHDRRDSVYAYAAELDTWLARRRSNGATNEISSLRDRRTVLAVAVIAMICGALVAGIANFRSTPMPASAVRVPFSVPPPLLLAEAATGGDFSISPDGQSLVFVSVSPDGTRQLWIRPLDALTAIALPETEGASYPFWSPDSQFVAFFAQRQLKKIAARGGPVQLLADALLPRGGTWNANGVILFAANGGEDLYRVPSAGGPLVRVKLDQRNRESHRPDFLPDGRHFVYYGRRPQPGIYVGSLDSPDTRLIAAGYMAAEYAAGHLLLLTGGTHSETSGTLMAQAFDTFGLRLVGEAATLAESVAIRPQFARGVFSTSDTGTVLYGTTRHQVTQLMWLDRSGREVAGVTKPGRYERAALSPDEGTVAVEVIDPHVETQDIWMVDAARGVMSRFTSGSSAERMPVWSPSGERLLFSSPRDGQPPRLFEKMVNGLDEKLVLASDLILQPTDWSRDGRFIIYGKRDSKTQWDIWIVPAGGNDGERTSSVYLQTPFNEHHGHLSADGRWMAYASDESGRWEVYVGAFPARGSRRQVSTGGGSEPRWRADGKELYYVTPDGTVMAAVMSFDGDAALVASSQALFKARFGLFGSEMFRPVYTPADNGRRFLVNVVVEETAASPVTMILNWPAAVSRARRAP
jgi:Tol biopolymer transport system component